MSKVKVLHIIKSLGRGGAEMLLPETLKLHDKNSFDFEYIYILPWKNQMVGSIESNGGRVVCFSARNNIQLLFKAFRIKDYVLKNNIQIIHAHLPWAGVLARIVGKLTGIPVIYTEHNKQERYHLATRFINLFTLNWLSTIIAVSDDVKKSIEKHKPYLKASLKTIVNGVNTEHFKPDLYSPEPIKISLGIPLSSPVIGTVAVFRTQKQLDVWLKLAKKIVHQIPECHFIIVGDGPLKERLIADCIALELEQQVHFVGLQLEVRPYHASFDLFMMTSKFEGLPLALLEAMASGCPVITTNAGGIKEVIRHNVDGLVCRVEETDALVDYALDLLWHEEKRKQLSKHGRLRIEREFSLQPMVDKLEQLYNEHVEGQNVNK